MEARADYAIPAIIHLVWLGDPPTPDVLNNAIKWKYRNPDYRVMLWIDSSTYSINNSWRALKNDLHNWLPRKLHHHLDDKKTKATQPLAHLLDICLMRWASHHKITIADLARREDKVTDAGTVLGQFDFFESMQNKDFYNDEISGVYSNFAAASDIARIEILHKWGGIYVDAVDILPGKQSLPRVLYAPCGFYCHINPRSRQRGIKLCNDVLASIPNGSLVTEYKQIIRRNYQALYRNRELINAHRNKEFYTPRLFGDNNPRADTTIDISGPKALFDTLNHCAHQFQHLDEDVYQSQVTFNVNYIARPAYCQRASWGNHPLTFVEFIRGFVKEYLIDCVQTEMNKLTLGLEQLTRSHDILKYQKTLAILRKITHWLHTLYFGSAAKKFKGYLHELPVEESDMLRSLGIPIIETIERCSSATHDFISQYEKDSLLSLSSQLDDLLELVIGSIAMRNEFLCRIIDTGTDKANYEAFEKMVGKEDNYLSYKP